MPTDPGACRWVLPDAWAAPAGQEVLAVGGDLQPATLLAGYRSGLFAMPERRRLLWFSPDPRGVMPLDGFHASRSLRRSCRAFSVSVDHAFADVLAACADPGRQGRWISAEYQTAYRRLHALGWAHSVEIWREDELAGGLIGVEVGGLFCGETMFHRLTDGSKAAVWATVAVLAGGGGPRLFDVQWATPHLASLGVIEVRRPVYLMALSMALDLQPVVHPLPATPFAGLDGIRATGWRT